MKSFIEDLKIVIRESQSNNFGIDNYDQHRFGKFQPASGPIEFARRLVKRVTRRNERYFERLLNNPMGSMDEYLDGLEFLYRNLNVEGKAQIVKLVAYRLLGYRKIKLGVNNSKYWESLRYVESLADPSDTFDPKFKHFMLNKFNLRSLGYDINLYFRAPGIVTDFIMEQYAYKNGGETLVAAQEGDVVLDLGACWGDTALYFASKVGMTGKVYSFEFIPGNIEIYNMNISANRDLADQIQLVPNPVSDLADETVYFMDNGPGSKIQSKPFDTQTGSVSTITIDEFVRRNNLQKVDFIKMDIEGAEPSALRGAMETIRRFKPKLAIAIYHSMDDFVNIPKWILDTDLGYRVYVDHFTIHAEETICFAHSI